MAEFPALTLWTDAYLSDTRHLSTLEHGAYLLLLMESWRRPQCDLPDDDKILSRLAGLTRDEWAEIKEAVMAFWKYDGRSKTWWQKRLRIERDRARVRSRSQSDKASKRWNKTKSDDAAAMPAECPADAPTAIPTAIRDEEPKGSPSQRAPKRASGSPDRPTDVSEQVWTDFLAHRRKLKADVTETVMSGFRREADRVGWPLERAIEESILRGWRGFKADWVKQDERSSAGWNGSPRNRPDRRDAITRAIDDELAQHGMDLGGSAGPASPAGRAYDDEPAIGRVVRYSPG